MAANLHADPVPKYVPKGSPIKRPIAQHQLAHCDDTKPLLVKAAVHVPNNGYIIIDKANANIKLCDANFNCISVLRLETCPFDVCVSNKNSSEVYITEPEKEAVHRISVKKGSLELLKSIDIEEDCRGITCWKSGIAVTVMRKGFTGTLGLLDYNGKVKKKTFETEFRDDLFRAPWYCKCIRSGTQIIVSDQGNHSLICVDVRSFTIVFILKHELVMGPRSMAVDNDDDIYVIGSNELCHNVVKVSAGGKIIGCVLSRKDGLNYPSGIALNGVEALFVLQINREKSVLSVFKC